MDFLYRVGLGLGRTQHSEAVPEGEVGRKGISCERTFRPLSAQGDLEAKVPLTASVIGCCSSSGPAATAL